MTGRKRKTIDLEEGWAFVKKGIIKFLNILEGKPEPPFSTEDYVLLQTTIYTMCTQKQPNNYSKQLHTRHLEVFDEYITSVVLPSLREKHDEFILRELVQRWSNRNELVLWFASIFRPLDLYLQSWWSSASLPKVGNTRFKESIYEKIKGQVKDAVISLMNKEREGEQIDRALLKNVLDIFVEIGLGQMDSYENDFEDFLLKDTTEYFSVKAQSWLAIDSCPEYMIKAEHYLKLEKERADHCYPISTKKKLREIVQNELLVRYATPLLENEHSGCYALLCDYKVEDLSRMYRLFSQISGGLQLISKIFKMYITNEGTAIAKQAEDSASNKPGKEMVGMLELVYMQKIIELHGRCAYYLADCFKGHVLFDNVCQLIYLHFISLLPQNCKWFLALIFLMLQVIKEAIEDFFEKYANGISSGEFLAIFSDNILKNGCGEKLSDEAIEEATDNVVRLLPYISDKDIFAEFHRKKFARRLLLDKTSIDEHEISMLTKLRIGQGNVFTWKMDRMHMDLSVSRDYQAKFEEFVAEHPELNPEIKLSVNVLTALSWPNYKTSDINLPAEMVKCVEAFSKFFPTMKEHRKLTWIYSLGTCYVNAKFDVKHIELIVSTFQAALLLLFNEVDRLSYSEIVTELNLPDDDVKRLLHSFSCSKYKILNKEPANGSISTKDVFEFNSKFTDRMRRIKISLPPGKKALEDAKGKVMKDIENDRKYAIEASIVRIMKIHKVMDHQQLLALCVEQLSCKFKPNIEMIKTRIQNLITREYLVRDNDNANVYKYLA